LPYARDPNGWPCAHVEGRDAVLFVAPLAMTASMLALHTREVVRVCTSRTVSALSRVDDKLGHDGERVGWPSVHPRKDTAPQ